MLKQNKKLKRHKAFLKKRVGSSRGRLFFITILFSIGLGEVPHVLDEMIPLMVWQSCAFTVISIVVSAMDMEKPVLGMLKSYSAINTEKPGSWYVKKLFHH